MQEFQKKNPVKFDDLQSQIDDKKKHLMQNLEDMRNKMKDHEKLFDSVHTMADKLPNIFDHFKNLVKNLGQKEFNEEVEDDDSDSDDNQIVQHDHTVEEDAFGPEDEMYDDEGEDSKEEEDKEKEDDKWEPNGDLDKDLDSFDEKMNQIGDHPNLVHLDDDIMDKIEQEQKEYEMRQKEQLEHLKALRDIDHQIVNNGRSRRNFNDRFIKYLGSDDMKKSPKDVKQHLHHLNDLFNARQI